MSGLLKKKSPFSKESECELISYCHRITRISKVTGVKLVWK